MDELVIKFSVSLILTLLFELMVALLWGVRRKGLLLVVLVNILTNPAAVLLSALLGDGRIVRLILEGAVILLEGFYYERYGKGISHGYLLSAAANTISYGLGTAINLLLI